MPRARTALSPGEPVSPRLPKKGHHAVDGADEAHEGGDADHDFEDDEAAFKAGDFVAGAGLEEVFCFRPW